MQTFRSIILTVVVALAGTLATPAAFARTENGTEGMLHATGPQGEQLGPCPLGHTDVQVRIAGFLARVDVTQIFHNPFDYKIEGVYVFPLSQDAAVDDMTMVVGDRVVRGVIKPREEARQIYEDAKAAGHVASLLDQERPNIFTQSVANIEPGEQVEIRISYVEDLEWQDGVYKFDFPMVVGPRYIPGGGSAKAPIETGQPTPEVPDADKITPPVAPEGMRAGHDISVTVEIDAGLPIHDLTPAQHEIEVMYLDGGNSEAVVRLADRATIPNKDFVLSYSTATDGIGDTLLTHYDHRGGFLTLVLQPPGRIEPEWIVPKDMIFVIDKSGSMSGFPIETAKATMRRCIENLNPDDTFNLMTFAGGVGFCFERSLANTSANRTRALNYLSSLEGSGGTEMMKAIEACLGGEKDPERVRIVCFMTDGYVGNDMDIIDAVKKHAADTRVFSFGIGSSVNRYLLDGIARAGRGEVEYVLSQAEGADAAERFYDRVSTPVLTDIDIDWGNLPVDEVHPALVPDLFSAKPVVVKARYAAPATGTITLTGRQGDGRFEREISVDLPGSDGRNDVIASLWARAKVAELLGRVLSGAQVGRPDPEIKNAVVQLGLEYRLMTPYTSFVAVEELTVTRGGEPTKVLVPVEMPDGVSYEGVFGPALMETKLHSCYGYGGFSSSVPGNGDRTVPRRARLDVKETAGFIMTAGPQAERTAPQENDASAEGVGSLERIIGEFGIDRNVTVEELLKQQTLPAKLGLELHGLAERLDEHGNYEVGRVKVVEGRIEVAVYLSDISDQTRQRLAMLGFRPTLQPKTAKMVIGTIEVRKLEELAMLDVVRRVQLPPFGND